MTVAELRDLLGRFDGELTVVIPDPRLHVTPEVEGEPDAPVGIEPEWAAVRELCPGPDQEWFDDGLIPIGALWLSFGEVNGFGAVWP